MAVAPATPSRPRPGGGRLFIIVGLLVAILGAGGLFFASSLFGGGGGRGGGGSTQDVVTAAVDIPLRHQLVKSDLMLTSVSGTNVHVFPKISDAVSLISQIAITKGEIITSDMVVKDPGLVTGSAVQYLPLPVGYVAMTIPTSEQQGVAGNIGVGDYITMIASANVAIFAVSATTSTQVGPPKFVVKTIFTNVHVIRLGPAAPPAPAANGATSTGAQAPTGQTVGITSSLTIAVTQCQAEYITWFLTNTTLRYTLESYNDYLNKVPTAASLGCPDPTQTKGISNKSIDDIFHFTTVV